MDPNVAINLLPLLLISSWAGLARVGFCDNKLTQFGRTRVLKLSLALSLAQADINES